jgi:hypothetical protein
MTPEQRYFAYELDASTAQKYRTMSLPQGTGWREVSYTVEGNTATRIWARLIDPKTAEPERVVKAVHPDAKVILVRGYCAYIDSQTCVSAGFDDAAAAWRSMLNLRSVVEGWKQFQEREQAIRDAVRYFWKEQAQPVVNAIGELSVQEAMDSLDNLIRKEY